MLIEPTTGPFAKAYSGRRGCMCGCRGNWHYTEEGSKLEPSTTNSVNPKAVKQIYTRIMNNPDHKWDDLSKCWYVDTDQRTLAVYLVS